MIGLFRKNPPPAKSDFEQEAMPHLDALYGAAMRLTRSPSDAEDLVQDTLLKAYRFHDRYESGTNMKAWLLKILTNTFINRYRRTARERHVFDGPDARPVGSGVMSRHAMRALTDPVELAHRRLVAAEIQRALELLPDDYRVMIELADVQELSYREIAEVVGCPIGTVMSRLHRARKTMQKHLVQQAIQMGIVEEPAEAEEEPISLEAFRKAREVSG